MSEPQKVDASTQPVAAGEKPQQYKCLLNEYAQKLWKQLPIYQTRNEGSDHLPKFRCTVWADGVSYTSPNTFQQRKMAEMDAAKMALFATKHKLKNEALRYVLEDKSFCKSILVEYAARKNIQKPNYETTQLDTPVPVFRSSLVFNDVSCTGDECKSKKEAEQSAARAVILKYLDSDSENIMSEIINSKCRHYAVTKGIPGAHYDTNAVVQTGFDNGINSNEAKVEEGTKMLNTSALPEVSLVQGTTIPPRYVPEMSTQALTPVIPVPTVLAQAPYAGTNSAPISSQISASSLENLARIIANHLSSNVVQPANSEASSVMVAPPLSLLSPALAQTMVVSQPSGKKRNRKNKKNAQKKMRVEDQSSMPAIAVSNQVPTFSSQ